MKLSDDVDILLVNTKDFVTITIPKLFAEYFWEVTEPKAIIDALVTAIKNNKDDFDTFLRGYEAAQKQARSRRRGKKQP